MTYNHTKAIPDNRVTYPKHLAVIESQIVAVFQPDERAIDCINGRYKGKDCFLVLTNQHIGCFRFWVTGVNQGRSEKCFWFRFESAEFTAYGNGLKMVAVSGADLRFYYEKPEWGIYFIANLATKLREMVIIDTDLEPNSHEKAYHRKQGCLSCAGLIILLMIVFGLLSECGSDDKNKDVCVGDLCWESEEQLRRDVCRNSPDLCN